MSTPTGGFSRITVAAPEGGKHYAIRDHVGTLTATGYIDPDGTVHRDTELTSDKPLIDGSNPAAMVPWNQKWE